MSALPPKADIVHSGGNVRFVPLADIVKHDGLHPEFVQLFERLAQGADANLSDIVEAPNGFEPGATSQNDAPDREAPKKP